MLTTLVGLIAFVSPYSLLAIVNLRDLLEKEIK